MARSLADRLANLFGVEGDEVVDVSLMFGAAVLLVAVQTTIKVVRDATFLSHFGIAELTYVMLGMAVFAGLALSAFNRVTAHRPRNRVIWTLNVAVAGSLVLFAVALQLGGSRIPVLLYLWSGIAGIAVLSEFWLLANEVFHARQAKRLFAIVAAGGVLGGIIGGATSRIFAKHMPVSYVLLAAAAELLVAALLCELAWRRMPPQAQADDGVAAAPPPLLKVFRSNAYARWIAVVAVLMTVATTLADWQFKAYAKLHFASHAAEMARFFGVIAVVLGILSFLLQLIGTHRLLRLVGAGGCMRALPVATGIGAAFVLSTLGLPVAPLIAAAAGSMLIDGVKFSIDRSATELLFTPLADETRTVVKRFVDTALDRFAGAVAAILWLGLIWAVGVDRPERLIYASIATLSVVALWLVAVGRLKGAYVDAYRAFIGAPVAASGDAPPVMSARGRRRAENLLRRMKHDAGDRQLALRSLTALQSSSPYLGLAPEDVDPHIAIELEELEVMQQIQAAFPSWGPPPLQTLRRMIERHNALAFERVIRLLAMLYPPSDVTSLHRALRRGAERQRAAALEFLDALVELPSKARLLAVVEAAALSRPATELLSKEEGLRKLLTLNNARVRACALWSGLSCGLLFEEARRLAVSDPSRRVRASTTMTLAMTRFRRQRPIPVGTTPVISLVKPDLEQEQDAP